LLIFGATRSPTIERDPGENEWLEALGGIGIPLLTRKVEPVDDQSPPIRVQHIEAVALESSPESGIPK
jgi:hypothetical protein